MNSVVLRPAGQSVTVELPDTCETVVWDGPEGVAGDQAAEMTRQALEHPVDAPGLSLTVVPGDRIVVGHDPSDSAAGIVLEGVVAELRRVGVGSITVLSPVEVPDDLKRRIGDGIDWLVHLPGDREGLAYLASTKGGRRVYLNRVLVDADAVVLTSSAGRDDRGRPTGPWTLLDLGLSDADALLIDRATYWDDEPPADRDPFEIAWLLGNPFQAAAIPGRVGPAEVIAGSGETFRERVLARSEALASLKLDDTFDLVIACMGDGLRPLTWDDFAGGLAAARRSARRGGQIVLLTDLAEPIGPSIGRLLEAGDDRNASRRLKGREADPDWNAAREIAVARPWADLFLMSKLNPDVVEELGLLTVEAPRQAARLAREARSCLILNQAERTFVVSPDSEKGTSAS